MRGRSVDEQRTLVGERINANSRGSKKKKREKKFSLGTAPTNRPRRINRREKMRENDLIPNPKKKKKRSITRRLRTRLDANTPCTLTKSATGADLSFGKMGIFHET